jgi:hypothetical protein
VTLIEGGYRDRSSSAKRRARRQRAALAAAPARRRRTARAAAPLLIPVALALTLGVILAVSSAPSTSHVQQTTTTGSTQP